MKDFSDQAMTMVALAPFAKGATLIRNIGHIRFQETDRIRMKTGRITVVNPECSRKTFEIYFELIEGLY